jgi:hypothetical protein
VVLFLLRGAEFEDPFLRERERSESAGALRRVVEFQGLIDETFEQAQETVDGFQVGVELERRGRAGAGVAPAAATGLQALVRMVWLVPETERRAGDSKATTAAAEAIFGGTVIHGVLLDGLPKYKLQGYRVPSSRFQVQRG